MEVESSSLLNKSATNELKTMALIVQMSAVTIAITMLFLPIPSIELISFSVFLIAYLFKFRTAISFMLTTVCTWEIIVSIILGPNIILFGFKILAWFLVLIFGKMCRMMKFRKVFEFSIVGIFLAVIWDFILIFAIPITFSSTGSYFSLLLTAFVIGLPITIFHIIGNACFFALLPNVIERITPLLELHYEYLLVGSINGKGKKEQTPFKFTNFSKIRNSLKVRKYFQPRHLILLIFLSVSIFTIGSSVYLTQIGNKNAGVTVISGEFNLTVNFAGLADSVSLMVRIDDESSLFNYLWENFNVTYKEYQGLGKFVTAINTIGSDISGYYWIIYINGLRASSGIEMIIPASGDLIIFKYE